MNADTKQQTVREFGTRIGIGVHIKPIDSRPDGLMHDSDNHWRVTFRVGKRQMSVYFSQGSACDSPKWEDVLDCLASDAASVENANGFEDWANDLGYDTDSREAERIWRACVKQSQSLKRLLGDSLYSELLWHTERL